MDFKIINTIGEGYSEKAKKTLAALGHVDYVTQGRNELLHIISDYDVAIIGLGVKFDQEMLQAAKKLKVIATATTGLDHIDTAFAREKGIEVISLKGETEFLDTITGTAELAFGLIIDLLRHSPWAFDDVKAYRWDRESFRGHNLSGLTLGVVGVGRLGRMLVHYGNAFGMRVLGVDPHRSEGELDAFGAKKVELQELLRASDVISLHVHLSKGTEQMINQDAITQLKPTACLVNTSRGEIVDESAVLQALNEHRLGGYATDVLAGEVDFPTRGFQQHPLVEYAKTHRNCIIVPHIGGMTFESREATDIFIADKVTKHVSRV